jgi:surface antigen
VVVTLLSRGARRVAATLAVAAVTCLALAAPGYASDGGYPYAHAPYGQTDPWGFTTRECTSYVAWRLNQAGDGDFQDEMVSPTGQEVVFGDADHWDTAARELGDRVSRTPEVGAIAQWNAAESTIYKGLTTVASPYGHVAYVVAVHDDGSVTVDQYNAQRPRAFNTMRVRAPRYLYIWPPGTSRLTLTSS